MSEIGDRDSRPSERLWATLADGLLALDAHTEAPLRLRGHASITGAAVFDLQEEFELGPRGRRFLVSVDPVAHETLLLPMARPGAIG